MNLITYPFLITYWTGAFTNVSLLCFTSISSKGSQLLDSMVSIERSNINLASENNLGQLVANQNIWIITLFFQSKTITEQVTFAPFFSPFRRHFDHVLHPFLPIYSPSTIYPPSLFPLLPHLSESDTQFTKLTPNPLIARDIAIFSAPSSGRLRVSSLT